MMSPGKKIFTIIVTHNGSETVFECLQSLQKSMLIPNIIVVENASTDDTPEIIQKFKNLVFLPQEKNIGFGQANNIGMKYALDHGADYVFLLNQDACVREDTLDTLVNFASENPQYGILSPIHLNGEGSAIDTKLVSYLNSGECNFLSDLFFSRTIVCYDVSFVNAAAWLISTDCVGKVGGFDDLFFMYGEDDDYCDRVLKFGYKIGIMPGSLIYHHRTGMRPKMTAWENIIQQAGYQASLIIAVIKKSRRPFLQTVILWRIDHHAAKLKLLFKGHFGDFLVLFLAGTRILVSLLRIYDHKKRSKQTRSFWLDN